MTHYDVIRTDQFNSWYDSIRDHITKRRIIAAIKNLSHGGGDVKPVGDGVFELRLFFGPGWRLYFADVGRT